MTKIIPILGMMSVNVFFAFSSVIGYQFKGTENSKIYLIYVVLVAFLNIGLCLYYVIFKRIKIAYNDLVILTMPFIPVFIFLFTGLLNGGFNSIASTYFGYFLLWSMPAIYAAVFVNKIENFKYMVKWLEVVMLLFTVAVIASNIIPFLNGSTSNTIGGATYQAASYIAAFAFGLNLYFIFFGNNHERFKFTRNILYSSVSKILLLIQLVGILLTGGRGGMVLAMVYTLYISLAILRGRDKKKKLEYFLFAFSFILVLLIVAPKLFNNAIFDSRFHRTFEFISSNLHINWAGTSNRDIVYLNAIELIKHKIFFGYGLYGFWDVCGYPHNIVLEILLNGGILYLMFSLMVFLKFVSKLFLMIKVKPEYRLVLILFLSPITHLMFSGTYMSSSELWFILALVLSNNNYSRKHYK